MPGGVVAELRRFDIDVQVADPLADPAEVAHEYGIELVPLDRLEPADAVILGVAHRTFVEQGWALMTKGLSSQVGIVLDIKGVLDRNRVPSGVTLWRL